MASFGEDARYDDVCDAEGRVLTLLDIVELAAARRPTDAGE